MEIFWISLYNKFASRKKKIKKIYSGSIDNNKSKINNRLIHMQIYYNEDSVGDLTPMVTEANGNEQHTLIELRA